MTADYTQEYRYASNLTINFLPTHSYLSTGLTQKNIDPVFSNVTKGQGSACYCSGLSV